MIIGAHTWEFPVLPDPAAHIPQLQAAGIKAIEASYHFFMTTPAKQIAGNASRLRDAGIETWSVHLPFGGRYNLSNPDEGLRRHAIEIHKWTIERSALAEVPVGIIHPGQSAPPAEIPMRLDALLDSLQQIVPVAAEHGMRLALENMPTGYPCADPRELRRIVEEVDSPSLRVCFDTGHANLVGAVVSGMEELKDLICTFHLQDNDTSRDQHLQPPYGSVPWGEFLRVFRTMDFRDPIMVECRPWQMDGFYTQRVEMEALLSGQLLQVPVGGQACRVRCERCGHARFGTSERSWCACEIPPDLKRYPYVVTTYEI